MALSKSLLSVLTSNKSCMREDLDGISRHNILGFYVPETRME